MPSSNPSGNSLAGTSTTLEPGSTSAMLSDPTLHSSRTNAGGRTDDAAQSQMILADFIVITSVEKLEISGEHLVSVGFGEGTRTERLKFSHMELEHGNLWPRSKADVKWCLEKLGEELTNEYVDPAIAEDVTEALLAIHDEIMKTEELLQLLIPYSANCISPNNKREKRFSMRMMGLRDGTAFMWEWLRQDIESDQSVDDTSS